MTTAGSCSGAASVSLGFALVSLRSSLRVEHSCEEVAAVLGRNFSPNCAVDNRRGHRSRGWQWSRRTPPPKPATQPAFGSRSAGGSSWTPEWLKFDNSYFAEVASESDPDLLVLPTDKAVFQDDSFRCAVRAGHAASGLCLTRASSGRGLDRRDSHDAETTLTADSGGLTAVLIDAQAIR